MIKCTEPRVPKSFREFAKKTRAPLQHLSVLFQELFVFLHVFLLSRTLNTSNRNPRITSAIELF